MRIFFWVKQYTTYLLLLQKTDRNAELERALLDSPLRSTNERRVEYEKLFGLFSQRIAYATRSGNKAAGEEAVKLYFDSLDMIREYVALPKVTRDLYVGAYFYFTHGNWRGAREVLYELSKTPRSGFPQKILPMVRFLSIMVDLETHD